MAHWAQLDENNIVIQVLVGDNNDPNNDEGYQWLIDNVGGKWVKTSYNSYAGKHYKEVEKEIEFEPGVFKTLIDRVESGQPHLRYNFAGIGYKYDEIADAFISPKPEIVDEEGNPIEFVLNTQTYEWEPTS